MTTAQEHTCCSAQEAIHQDQGGREGAGPRCRLLGPRAALPDGVVGGAEVDEEVPGPVGHLQQISHALQVRGQEAGAAPDGGHPPGRDADIAVLLGELEHLAVQVVGALFPGRERGDSQLPGRHPDMPRSPLCPFPSRWQGF